MYTMSVSVPTQKLQIWHLGLDRRASRAAREARAGTIRVVSRITVTAGRSGNGTKGSQAGMRPRDGINKGSEVGLRTTLDGMRTSPGGGRGPGAQGVDVISVEESIVGVNA